ncbi:hypothetical protein V8C35DRAFT_329155 [Trichoderma chlorosporum]
MSSPLQALARSIQAAASAPSEDGQNIYLVEEDSGSLLQQLWVGDEPGTKTFVTDEVKANTPVVYLVNKAERYIFFLDDENHLKCVSYDEESEEWGPAPFNDTLSSIEVQENTRFSGFSNPWGMMIFFEANSGQLSTLVGHDGQWKVTETLPTQVKPGAAHVAFEGQDKLNLFCFGADDKILHVVRDHATGSWHSSVLKEMQLEALPSRILASPSETHDSLFDIYVMLSNSKLIEIGADSTESDLGVIKGSTLIPSTAAECCIIRGVGVLISTLLGNPYACHGNTYINTGNINYGGTMSIGNHYPSASHPPPWAPRF